MNREILFRGKRVDNGEWIKLINEESIHNLATIYSKFKRIGKFPYTLENHKEYKSLQKQVFPLLLDEYRHSGDTVDQIEEILNVLEEESRNPVAYWGGSEKIAAYNHYVFIDDMNGRLLEQLRKWYEGREQND